MNMPLWFSNLLFWSAQVALLALAGGFLPGLFQIRQPRVLLAYWRAILGLSLVLPFVEPWHRMQSMDSFASTPGLGSSASQQPIRQLLTGISPASKSSPRFSASQFWPESALGW